MSTNNNRLGKEVQPIWLNGDNSQALSRISGAKLQRLMSNSIEELTALSLKGREITKIDDFRGFIKLQRLDLSENKIKKLHGLLDLKCLGMLNLSNNLLDGSSSCEELRYLTELRTLNIGSNPTIRHLESHVIKPLSKLQAFIANDCGLSKISFLKSCPLLNTLVLSHNNLARFPTSFSSEFSFLHLTKLSLGYNELTTMPDLSICPNLTELRLNNNRLTSLTNAILVTSKLKILDISNNLLSSWTEIEILTRLSHLTNLCMKGNPLPPAPNTYDNSSLREDVFSETHEAQLSAEEKRYRHHVLSMFQILVGSENKPKVRLIVFDMKRVKMKWSHHFADNAPNAALPVDEEPQSTKQEKKKLKDRKKEKVMQPPREVNESNVLATRSVQFPSEMVQPTPAAPPRSSGPGHTDLISGVVGVKILKKNKKRERNEQGPQSIENNDLDSQKSKKKIKKDLMTESNPLTLLTHASTSSVSIGGGGTSQWD